MEKLKLKKETISLLENKEKKNIVVGIYTSDGHACTTGQGSCNDFTLNCPTNKTCDRGGDCHHM